MATDQPEPAAWMAASTHGEASERRVKEAIKLLREKPIQSTTLERLRVTWEADQHVQGLPQPLQLGEGLFYLLDHIALPVAPDDLILGRILEEVPDAAGEVFFRDTVKKLGNRAIPSWMRDGGHECFAWSRLLEMGLPGLEEQAKREFARRTAERATQQTLDWLQGAIRVYQAFRQYARRYAESARQAELDAPARNCNAIAEHAPSHFAEAVQLMWLVGHVFCTMLSQNPTLTFGRIDELLLPFYERDISSGRLSREEAGDLIQDFYCKNNIVLGRGEHQMSGGSGTDTGWQRNLTYDAPQYIVLCGTRQDGSEAAKDLTRICLERIVPRFENPVVVVRYTSDLPEDAWRLVCDKMRANSSMLIYNDHNIIPAMIHAGIEPQDAVTYTMHGCNWPDIPGIQHALGGCTPVLPKHFLQALMGDGDKLPQIDCMDDVYARFREIVRDEITQACDGLRERRHSWAEQRPGSLRVNDCFSEGPIEHGYSWQFGSMRYHTITCAISSIATAADSFATLDHLVFREDRFSLAEFREALCSDFADHEALRQACIHAPKFGQDDDRADRHAVRMLNTVLEEIDQASRAGATDEAIVFRCLETDMRHRNLGVDTGATADGRHAGEPTSENTSPSPGASIHGLTAMLRSVAKLPLNRINSGALNVRLQTRLVEGQDGLDSLAALLRTYFDLGGLQAQLSVADTDQLREAQRCPEDYRDLMVRITGYSAAFVDMCKAAQDEIIRREEMGA